MPSTRTGPDDFTVRSYAHHVPYPSEHFQIQEVAPGAWAAVATSSGACVSNAGIVDLGDSTLVFDTFMTPEAATDLHEAARALTGRRASLVVNSHHHSDHMRGNQVFDGADIIATARSIELMAESAPPDLEVYAQELKDQIRWLNDRLLTSEDPRDRQELQLAQAMVERALASVATLSITLPTRTYDGSLVIDGTERTAHLMSYGAGHTDSDTFLHLPDCGVVFAGDLLFVERHPWAGDGNPDAWIDTLDRMEALDIGPMVPGHGTVTTFAYAQVLAKYLTFVCDIIRTAESTKVTVAKVAATPVPPQYRDWANPVRFRESLTVLATKAGIPEG